MSEWWTYRLTSFLLFSPRTYHRLFELYNVALWPLQIAALAIGVAIVALLVGPLRHRERVVAGLLALCWAWTGWAFLYERYAQINWVAPWIALAFALEALLLAGLGVLGGRIALERPAATRTRIAAGSRASRSSAIRCSRRCSDARGRPARSSGSPRTPPRSRPRRRLRSSAAASAGCCCSSPSCGARSRRRRYGR